MKQQLLSKRWFVSLLLTLMSTISWAYDLEIDGMYYNLNSDEVSVSLTYKSMTEFVYTGDVVIPSSVKYRGRSYKVTAIGDDAFAGCEELTSVSIPDEVETIGSYAFAGCDGLTSITIPGGVKTIKAYAFNICESLSSIVIPQNVQTIEDNAFSDCSALTSVTINSNAILSKNYSEDNNLKNIFGEQIKEYIIGDNVTSIGEGAFSDCSSLTSVTIPESVTSIGDYAFKGCSGLTSVTINSNAILSKNYTFRHGLYRIFGEQVKEYIIGNSVTSIGSNAFSWCSGLTSINIPNSVTSIGDDAFSWCPSLPIIDNIRYADTYLVIAVDDTQSTYNIKAGTRFIGSSAFWGCSGLTSINIPNSVKSIGDNAFRDCSGLTSVTINSNAILSKNYTYGNSLKYIFGEQVKEYIIGESVTSIGEWAFDDCSSLTSITIPNSVTSIGERAFLDCSGLTSITIPNSVTSIGGSAFWGCSGLKSVTCLAKNVPTTGGSVFDNVPQSTAILYVPETSVNKYKTADQWKEFGNIVGIDPTAVEEVKSKKILKANENAPIFDLMGRRLQQKPASGYYIQGGKKYFVK